MIEPRTSIDSTERREDRLAIRLLLAADTVYARIFNRLTVVSPCTVQEQGPGVLVCNHISSIDPAFVQAVCRDRLITWMMAKEYMNLRSMRWLFNSVGIIPVERTGRDTAPLRAALRALKAGRIIGVFPEGKISESQDMLPFQTGAALMAIKTGAPVYPVYLDGTQRKKGMLQAAFGRNQAKIAFGPPLYLKGGTSREELDSATAAIRSAMELLRREIEAYRYPL